jgi:hypothetical protein
VPEHSYPEIDPNDPATWPALLRERDICKRPDYPGLLPLTQSAFRDAVARGAIEPPIRFGPRINCWRKPYILRLQHQGIPRRPLAEARDHAGRGDPA